MSAAGDFTPPDHGGAPPPGPPPPPPPGPGRRAGLPLGAALGILAGVLVLGLVAIFVFDHADSSGDASFALAGPTPGVGLPPRDAGTAPGPDASGLASVPVGSDPATADPGGSGPAAAGQGGASGAPGSSDAGVLPTPGPAFHVGECVDTSGSGADFDVVQTSCTGADYKIIYAFQNETGNVTNDQAQCYGVNGTDDEFENGAVTTGYTLYCMNSLTGDYSPRRAAVDNCLDAKGEYEVDCTSSRAAWIVIGRLNGTTNTKGCSQFGSYDYSYYWSTPPPFVLCVNRYQH